MNYTASHVRRCYLKRTLFQHEIRRPYQHRRKLSPSSMQQSRDFSRCRVTQSSQDAADTSSSEISKQPSVKLSSPPVIDLPPL